MIALRNVLFVLFLVFRVSGAFAETVAATGTTKYQTSFSGGPQSTSLIACNNTATHFNATVLSHVAATPSSQGACTTSASPYTPVVIISVSTYVCPDSSWTLSGTSCTRAACPAGQERLTNGSCAVPCQSGYDRDANGVCIKNCTGKAGQPTVNGTYEFSGAVSEWSVGQCKVTCPKRVLAAGGGIGYDCKFTGASASPDQPEAAAKTPDPKDPPPEKPLDCASKGLGYIQSSTGAITCVASESAPPGQKPTIQDDKKSESGTPGTDGKPDPTKPDYEKKETSTSTNGGETTTKETTTKNPTTGTDGTKTCPSGYTMSSDQTSCTKVSSTTESTSDFCVKNPTASACKGSSPDSCTDNPNRASCKDLGELPAEGNVEEKAVGVNSISIIPVSMANSCPTGDALPRGAGNYNFQPMCDFAGAMKPIILAFAWIAAFLIVIGVAKD